MINYKLALGSLALPSIKLETRRCFVVKRRDVTGVAVEGMLACDGGEKKEKKMWGEVERRNREK
jgi:hypothetical protein